MFALNATIEGTLTNVRHMRAELLPQVLAQSRQQRSTQSLQSTSLLPCSKVKSSRTRLESVAFGFPGLTSGLSEGDSGGDSQGHCDSVVRI
jgi:hypothetical protein